MFHVSSLLAVAWHGATAPFRLKNNSLHLSTMLSKVCPMSSLNFGNLSFCHVQKPYFLTDYVSMESHLEWMGDSIVQKDEYIPFHLSRLAKHLSADQNVDRNEINLLDCLIGEWATLHGGAFACEKVTRPAQANALFENYLYSQPCPSRGDTYIDLQCAIPYNFPEYFSSNVATLFTDLTNNFSTRACLSSVKRSFDDLCKDPSIAFQYTKSGELTCEDLLYVRNMLADAIENYTK